MSTTAEKLEALHREFGTAGTALSVAEYNRRLAELHREERLTKAAPESVGTVRERMAALDREFNAPGSTMRLDVYNKRLEELLAEERREEPAPVTEAAAPAPAKPKFVTLKFFDDVLGYVFKELGADLRGRDDRLAALEKRLGELEAAHAKTVEAHNSTVTAANSAERRLSRHSDHLSRLEGRVRAVETSGPTR